MVERISTQLCLFTFVCGFIRYTSLSREHNSADSATSGCTYTLIIRVRSVEYVYTSEADC